MKINKKDLNLLPNKIVGTYTDDYDIIYVHEIIIDTLSQEKKNLPEMYKELELLKKAESKIQTFNDKNETLAAIDILNQKIQMIINDQKITSYKEVATPLVQKYMDYKLNGEYQEKIKIIDKYIKHAKKYIDIQVKRQIKSKKSCLKCNHDLEYDDVSTDGILRCSECRNEHQVITTLKHVDHSKTNTSLENDMENFIKALNRYQGLQSNPPKALYAKLDTYFSERGLPSAEYIRSLPYNDRGKKGNVNKEMLYAALSSIGYSSYYEDVNLIGHIYWDWKLPDLTLLKDTIIRHYLITQKSFYKIPLEIRDRISSLGTSYRLWKHLELVGVPVYQDDFKIAENPKSINNHKRLWKLMCENADDDEIYYID